MAKKVIGWVMFGLGLGSLVYFLVSLVFGVVPPGGIAFVVGSLMLIIEGWFMAHSKPKVTNAVQH